MIGVVGTIVGFGLLKKKNKDNNKDNNKGIKLTMDNYRQYLDVSPSRYLTGEYGLFRDVCPEQTKDGHTTWDWYKEIIYSASVNGVSTNYNYNDVVVVFKVSGTYDTFDLENGEWVREEDNPIDLTIEVTTDIAGNGDDSKTISSGRWIHENLVNATIEVVSVSGTVTPVK